MCDQQSLRSACPYGQSDQSLCLSLEYLISISLPTEHRLMFLSLTAGCTGSSESTLVKMPHCWKSHVMAQITNYCLSWHECISTLSSTSHCVSGPENTVTSEIFARVLFSRNFAYAKFRENNILANWRNHSVIYCRR